MQFWDLAMDAHALIEGDIEYLDQLESLANYRGIKLPWENDK